MMRVFARGLAATALLTEAAGMSEADASERKGEVELLSVGVGGHATSSKPKEIVVVPSKDTRPKPSSTQDLTPEKGGQRALLTAIQPVRSASFLSRNPARSKCRATESPFAIRRS